MAAKPSELTRTPAMGEVLERVRAKLPAAENRTPQEVLKLLERKADMEQQCANTREETLIDMGARQADVQRAEKYARVKQQKQQADAAAVEFLMLAAQLKVAMGCCEQPQENPQ